MESPPVIRFQNCTLQSVCILYVVSQLETVCSLSPHLKILFSKIIYMGQATVPNFSFYESWHEVMNGVCCSGVVVQLAVK